MQPTRVKTEDPISAAFRLQQVQALRVAELANKTAQVCMKPPQNQRLEGALALSEAAMRRTVELQTTWMRDWADWLVYAQTIQGADTSAKYAERMGNIVLQAETQVTNQVTQAAELVDNIAVSYGYWLNQQLQSKD